jgi:nitrite reductase/ring-hydroxylating ferredoxin subunit
MPTRFYKVYDFELDGAEPQQLNSVRTVEVEGTRLCLARLEDSYYALDDKCPHAGGRLGLGKCDENGYVICPIHRYRYNAKTGRGLPVQGDYVESYPVEVRKDGVYVGLKKKWWQF